MNRRRGVALLLIALVFPGCARRSGDAPSAAPAPAAVATVTPGEGLVVEEVPPGSAGARAGLLPGDSLTSWRREPAPPADSEPAEGPLVTPFDLDAVELEAIHRGPVTLFGERGGAPLAAVLPPGRAGIVARPPLDPPREERYRRASEAREGEGAAALGALAGELAAERPLFAAWLHLQAARRHGAAGRADAADAARDEALELARAAGDAWAESLVRSESASARFERGDFEGARAAWAAAAELLGGDRAVLRRAAALHSIAIAELRRGDPAAAAELLGRALALQEGAAPGSLEVARTLNTLGRLEATRGDLEAAEERFGRAAAIRERLDPEGIDVAHSFNSLGVARTGRGDLAAAEQAFARALARFEALDRRGRHAATALHNLGVLAEWRGDLAAAEAYFLRSRDLAAETAGAESLEVANFLNSLAGVARARGDLDAAEERYERALAIRRRIVSGTVEVAYPLTGLAHVALDRGEPARAVERLEEALAIRERLAPDGVEVAGTEADLARAERARGRLDAAERRLDHAEAILRRRAPGSFQLALAVRSRGDLALDRGRWAAAGERYREAAAAIAAVAPGSAAEAQALWGLARALRGAGRAAEAVQAFARAEAVLEAQQGRVGGGEEGRAGFRARYDDLYREHLELLLEIGRPAAAFEVLERSRARVFLALLAERDLEFAADLPAPLDAERRRAAAAAERAHQARIEASAAAGREEVAELDARLRSAREHQQEVAARVRAASPRLAALTAPRPLGLRAALAALDPGTVALAYSLGPDGGRAFVLGPGRGFRVAAVAAGEAELRRRVERLRLLIEAGSPAAGGGAAPEERAAIERQAGELAALLLAPAAAELARAERLLVLSEGALLPLPFAVLPLPGPGSGSAPPLAAALPVHTAASLTAWAELRERRRERPPALAAFGDPAPPLAGTAAAPGVAEAHAAASANGSGAPAGGSAAGVAPPTEPVLRSLASGAGALPPLPGSRAEAVAVAEGYGRAGAVYLGAAATEARARAAAAERSHLHFAVHGVLDERFPLSSGLLLARDPVGGEDGGNGLLQAWEILESVRTDADLVVLSGCETALGREVAGEGLLGLTRAFQHAGARAVAASLWRVSDRSTAALMSRFYARLRAGLPAAEALAAAQAELAAGPVAPPAPPPAGLFGGLARRFGLAPEPPPEDFTHPFHWAAFRLDGDWR